jgi:protein phosphatase
MRVFKRRKRRKEMPEEIKKTIIKKLNIPTDKRLIFVSDMHGDLVTFKKGLEEINYSADDYLFVIGDMIVKGDPGENLKMLDFVIALSHNENVYMMSGNCDEVFRFILPEEAHKATLYYVNTRKLSVLNDILEKENFRLDTEDDVKVFKEILLTKYKKYYDFMDSLTDVIFINDKIVLVHGGIDDLNNIPEYALPMLKYDNFYNLASNKEKIMIVGHNPTRNYRLDVSCVNPIFDFKKNIFSIDGGNHVVKGGQINFVMIDNLCDMNISFHAIDHYEKYVMKDDVIYKNANGVNITFGNNEIEIVDQDLDFYLVKHVKTDTIMWVHKSFVYYDKTKNKYYSYDGTNQFISVSKGDVISVVKRGEPYSLIKKDGLIGMIDSRYIKK